METGTLETDARTVTEAPAPQALRVGVDLPEKPSYRAKRALLGPPLTTDQLAHERLSKKLALGVLASDCISSSAYGSEEILLVLLPVFGIAAYALLLPMTLVVLAVLLLVTLTYRQVVTTYTKAGGSYVVARENFGPLVAQVGAVALMLDYIVTVAVQAAAGTAAVTSAVPALASWSLWITVGVVLVLFYGNLRGIREAGRAFAFPTYFFLASMTVVIVTGVVRELLGDLPQYDPMSSPGAFPVGHGSSLLTFGAIFILMKSFANGGSSLTGLEAISNGVSTFHTPQGLNARKTLVVMSSVLAFLVGGVSWLAHETHAVPYESGSPTVISQVAKAVFGDGAVGHVLFLLVQTATMLILYTGANTPFNGFPFLANFVAGDGFLPRWLTKRGHRLAFSNGIIVLTVVSLALIIGTGAHVDKLVAFYAIGVFTGFTLAGFGMARHYQTYRQGRWRAKVALNLVTGAVSALVVVIFAVTKFTEGAWLVVLVFPVMVVVLLRLHRTYQREAAVLRASPSAVPAARAARNVVLVLVDSVDLAVIRAIRYARTLRPSEIRVVHFVIDSAHAEVLQREWDAQPGLDLPLELVDCPDRRLPRAALELVDRVLGSGESTQATVLLPRRSYGALLGRLLHDRTADDIAAAVSQVAGVAATIVPFDASRAPWRRVQHEAEAALASGTRDRNTAGSRREGAAVATMTVPEGCVPIAQAPHRRTAVLQGRIRSCEVSPISGSPALRCELVDDSGGVTLLFYGRRAIPGIEPGANLRVEGRVGDYRGHLAMANPIYRLLPRDGAVPAS
ncbi:amino acid permease [Oryzihumus leptocrescens]|uniref:Amino acid transporter n=1 Tax=Oryzihumus leptocrescens TaxID=297536 RepID=A0A542ZNJ7_9MICO|nr:amino acid permease [Oryzihumus leptocrescens]TQL61964.1 amino acid transporter [Oryzihumus leptocrescens]